MPKKLITEILLERANLLSVDWHPTLTRFRSGERRPHRGPSWNRSNWSARADRSEQWCSCLLWLLSRRKRSR